METKELPEQELADWLVCVGPGWHDIIKRLVVKLDRLGWDGDIIQIKEKWGTMSFYVGAGSPEIWAAIDEAELESGRTCEDCGEPGKHRTRGWRRTVCDACNEASWASRGVS